LESSIVYFKNPGLVNTEEVFRIVRKRAEELGIKTLLIASTRGEAAVMAAEAFQGFRTVFVTHHTSYLKPNFQEFSEENRKIVESKGGIVLTTAHTFMGPSRAIRFKYNMSGLGDVIADTLRMFGEGMKVCCEITMMAADSGLVRTDEDIIAIAGTVKGADTAIVLTPVISNDLFDLRVKEILCKPRL